MNSQTNNRYFTQFVLIVLVLPPVLVPRHSEFAPGHSLLPFQQMPEPTMPANVSYSSSGFNAGPTSPLSSVPSPATSNPHSPYSANGLSESPPPAYSPPDESQHAPSPALSRDAMDTGTAEVAPVAYQVCVLSPSFCCLTKIIQVKLIITVWGKFV